MPFLVREQPDLEFTRTFFRFYFGEIHIVRGSVPESIK